MDIPREGQFEEKPSADWTLINELESIARQTDETIEESEYETNGTPEASTDEADFPEVRNEPDAIPKKANFHVTSGATVDQLLDQFGGHVGLEIFLRSLAKARGYQRLGKDIRRSLMRELNRLERRGQITLDRLKHEIARRNAI